MRGWHGQCSSLALSIAVLAASGAARAAETFIPKLLVGDPNTYLQLYGQIDPGLLIADDGQETLGYAPVDNGNSSTRLGLRFYMGVYGGAFVGANVEAAYDPYSTNFVNRLNRGDPDWDRYLLRKAEGYFNSKQTGVLWLGQGSTASDGTAEIDLSGTEVIGYASIGELAGGQLFAFTHAGGLSDIDVGDVFNDFDGDGRKLRARYDTPAFAGFTLSGSYGTEVVPEPTGVDVWDVALRYAGEFAGFRIASAIAYSDTGSANRYDGSISILSVPTGISVTAASGYDQRSGGADGRYFYGKLGYQRQFFDSGVTAFSLDIYSGHDIKTAGSESFSWGGSAGSEFRLLPDAGVSRLPVLRI